MNDTIQKTNSNGAACGAKLLTDKPQQEELEDDVLRSYNGRQLLESEGVEIPMLVEGLIPRCGVVSLIGSSDTGKSSLLRQLACCVVGGKKFLEMKTNPQHHRVIYVSSEDDNTSLSVLLKKQNKELKVPVEAMSGLDFVFDTYKLLETLDAMTLERGCDMIIIDAFSDVFSSGSNLYNTAEVRSFLQDYALLAQRRGLVVVFLHHTNKRSDHLNPSKHNALGSQGFEAKMRLVLELRVVESDPSKRYLCIDKGNYISYEQKKNAIVLSFSEGLIFRSVHRSVPLSQIGQREGSDIETLRNEVETIEALHQQGHTYTVIAEELGISERTLHNKRQNFKRLTATVKPQN